jgi:putative transposase
MGNSVVQRAENYAAWLKETVPEWELQRIREAVQRDQLIANGAFAQELSQKLGRRLEPRGPGRPRKDVR